MNELSQSLKTTDTVVVIFSFLSCLFSSTLIHEWVEWAFVYQAKVLKSQKVKQFGKYHHFYVYFSVCLFFSLFFFPSCSCLSYTKHKSIAVIVRKTLKTLRENISMWIGKKKKKREERKSYDECQENAYVSFFILTPLTWELLSIQSVHG